MTHNTDAERAEFEEWAIEDPEIMAIEDCFAKCRYTGEYVYQSVRIANRAWQAARRAPAAAVPQGWNLVPAEPHTGSNYEAGLWSRRNWDAALEDQASAPQPPEAAPVQMPEPVGVAFTFETEEGGPIASQITSDATRLPMGWCRLYTEQQVRELLAAHGIKVAP